MRIVLCYPVTASHIGAIAEVVETSQGAGRPIEIVDAGQHRIATELLKADIFCGHAKVPVDWKAVVDAGRLQWIQSSAAGLDHCLVPPVVAADIRVTSASGLFADQVAEHTMALLLGSLRSMPTFYRAAQAKEFVRRPTDDLKGKTVGIVGMGGNGRRIAEVLKPFHVSIVATDMFPENRPEEVDRLWPADELHRLLTVSDVVVLALPLTKATDKLIGQREISLMKPGAMLVNVARGGIVDENALIEALHSGQLSAAALDVVENEPLPRQSDLWRLSTVIITPHVAAQSAERVNVTTRFFCENLRRYFNGDKLMNLVDKTLGFPRPETRFGPE
jgi:phosphoglycerate dehydrogenase-like enzyme